MSKDKIKASASEQLILLMENRELDTWMPMIYKSAEMYNKF